MTKNNEDGLLEKSIQLDKIMQGLAGNEAKPSRPKEPSPVQAEPGYLTYHDICVLFGERDWAKLDLDLAASIARQLVVKHNLPVIELRDSGKFLVNLNYR